MTKEGLTIAIVGNMNNNHFALCRYLWDLGLSVNLYVFKNEPSHFKPEADTFNIDDYSIFELNWTIENFKGLNRLDIYSEFIKYDVIIAESIAMGILKYAGIKVHLFTPFGGDIYHLPFFRQKNNLRTILKRVKNFVKTGRFLFNMETFAKLQYQAIQEVDAVVAFNPERKIDLLKLKILHKWQKVPLPMIYKPSFDGTDMDDYKGISEHIKGISDLRDKYDYLFLNHARQYWIDHGKGIIDSISHKGNDKLIRGFADYLRHSKKKACLILLEYGPDVNLSKELIKSLGVTDNIIWLPVLKRKEIMLLIKHVDIVCNEFTNSSIGGGVIFEALSMNKPLMGFRKDDQFLKYYGDIPLYPMMNVKSEEQIRNAFLNYERNKNYYVQLGQSCGKWYDEQIVNKSLDFFTNYFNCKRQEKYEEKD